MPQQQPGASPAAAATSHDRGVTVYGERGPAVYGETTEIVRPGHPAGARDTFKHRPDRPLTPEDVEKDEKEENYRRIERSYGSFTRTFTLPNMIDAEQVTADYDKGVLKIRLAKKAEAKPKQIKVNIGSDKTLEGKEAKSAGRAA